MGLQPQAVILLHPKKVPYRFKAHSQISDHINRVILSLRDFVLDASHTVSTTIPPSKPQTLMAQFDAPFLAPPLYTPPQDPFATPLTAPAFDTKPENEAEWEYEYSTTETEVCAAFLNFLLNIG